MLRRSFVAVGLALVLAGCGGPAAPRPHAPTGWNPVADPAVYAAQNLYGYIDGGAELFLEVGFKQLEVYKLTDGSRELGVDIYRMSGPDAALAIYLAKCAPETPVPDLDLRATGDRYQLAMLRGDDFILINNVEGDETLVDTMKKVARDLAGQIPAVQHEYPVPLPENGLVAGSVRLVRGPFGLQPVYTLGEGDVLGLDGRLWAVVGDYDLDGRKWTLIRVDYGSPAAAEAALESLKGNLDSYLTVLDEGPDRLVFQDFAGQYGEAVTDGKLLDIRVHLTERPDAGGA